MVYDIIIGRNEVDRKEFGKKGTILIGRHYVKMGQTTSLSNNIYMDVARSHVVFVCGKRGSGKSYTMGVIAEGISELPTEIAENLAVVIFDTMGIYWTMKHPNKKDEALLDEWKLKAKSLNVQVYTPKGYYKDFKEKGIPTDFPFSIKPSELSAADWCLTFDIDINNPIGVLIERVIAKLKKNKTEYSINDIITIIQKDTRVEQNIKDATENRFINALSWGLFSIKATPIEDLVKGNQITVLDISCYTLLPGAQGIRALVIGLVSQKLFIERMVARKTEEFQAVKKATSFLSEEEKEIQRERPLIWLIVDEAHEFLPNEGETAATNALITILREGRQPGISLVLASQQPGKIHTDVMTQADIVISHRITAEVDVKALGMLMQSYMREGLDKQLNYLPRVNGAGIIFDDVNERLYPMKVKPRHSWHGGEAPIAIQKIKKTFEL